MFGLRKSLAQLGDPALRLLDRAPQCLPLFGNDPKQLLRGARQSALCRFAHQIASGAVNQFLQRRDQLAPVASGTAILDLFRRAGFENHRNRPVQPLFKHATRKSGCRSQLARIHAVCLVQHEQQVADLLRDGFDQWQALRRKWADRRR